MNFDLYSIVTFLPATVDWPFAGKRDGFGKPIEKAAQTPGPACGPVFAFSRRALFCLSNSRNQGGHISFPNQEFGTLQATRCDG
jgi:hypothetical protein